MLKVILLALAAFLARVAYDASEKQDAVASEPPKPDTSRSVL